MPTVRRTELNEAMYYFQRDQNLYECIKARGNFFQLTGIDRYNLVYGKDWQIEVTERAAAIIKILRTADPENIPISRKYTHPT